MTNREYKYRTKLVAEAGIKKHKQQRIERNRLCWEGWYIMNRTDRCVESIYRSAKEESK